MKDQLKGKSKPIQEDARNYLLSRCGYNVYVHDGDLLFSGILKRFTIYSFGITMQISFHHSYVAEIKESIMVSTFT